MVQVFAGKMVRRFLQLKESILWGPSREVLLNNNQKQTKQKAAGGWSALVEWVNFFLLVISLYNFVFPKISM